MKKRVFGYNFASLTLSVFTQLWFVIVMMQFGGYSMHEIETPKEILRERETYIHARLYSNLHQTLPKTILG